MDTLVTDYSKNPEGTSHVTAQCGKMSAVVCSYKVNRHVTVHNTTHGRGMYGRTFHGTAGSDAWNEALRAYKSPEMKSIIEAARDFIIGTVTFTH